MKQKILKAQTSEQLEEKVQELLDAGWEIQGTPFVLGNMIHQALIAEMDRESSGITPDDIATLSLLRHFRHGRRWL